MEQEVCTMYNGGVCTRGHSAVYCILFGTGSTVLIATNFCYWGQRCMEASVCCFIMSGRQVMTPGYPKTIWDSLWQYQTCGGHGGMGTLGTMGTVSTIGTIGTIGTISIDGWSLRSVLTSISERNADQVVGCMGVVPGCYSNTW